MRSLKRLFFVSTILATIALSSAVAQQNNAGNSISWLTMEEAQNASADDKKPVFVFIEADWCGICKRMLESVFPKQEVSAALADKYHPVSIDLDSKREILFNGEVMTEREFAKKMEVQGTPTTIFFSAGGKELGRQTGFIDTGELNLLLAYITSDQFPDVPLEEFKREGI